EAACRQQPSTDLVPQPARTLYPASLLDGRHLRDQRDPRYAALHGNHGIRRGDADAAERLPDHRRHRTVRSLQFPRCGPGPCLHVAAALTTPGVGCDRCHSRPLRTRTPRVRSLCAWRCGHAAGHRRCRRRGRSDTTLASRRDVARVPRCVARTTRLRRHGRLARTDAAAVRTGPAAHLRIRASGPTAAPYVPSATLLRRSTLRVTGAATPRCRAAPARSRRNEPTLGPCPPATPDTPAVPR